MPLEKVTEYFRGSEDPLEAGITAGIDPGTTDEMPVVPHKVLHADVPFFEDEACTKKVRNGSIVILRPLDPDGFDELAIVPTQKKYKEGQYLNWQLDKESQWEENYFKNPISGKVEKAWILHVAFVGKVISDKAIQEDKGRIETLEQLFPADKTH